MNISLVIKYCILALILWYLPGFSLFYFESSLSSPLSYLSYILILIFIIINGKSGNCTPMLIVGACYFLISSLANQAYMPDFKTFVIIVFKYFIIIWGGYEVMKKTSSNEMGIFMLIGALSILANTFLFENPKGDNGRYSGFYIDPNNAGLICSIGFALSFVFRKSLRIISKTTFTLLGILTFSRTFIVSWLLLNIVSIKLDIKNAKMIGIGFFLLSSLLIYNEFLPNKNVRLEQLGAMISGGDSSSSKGLQKDSRLDTWSRYFDALQDKPFFGNGYLAFGGNGVAPPVGVHNTYLMIMGESGIFTLLIFICYIIWLGIKCIKHFQEIPHVLMMLIALFLFLMTNHNFFTTDYSLLILVWIHTQVEKQEKDLTINLQTNAV